VQQHPPPILLDTLGITTRLEVNGHWIDAVNLLVGIAAAIANGDYEHQQIRSLFGYLRKDLDKIERPVLPRVLPGVGQAVVPGLEFIQQQPPVDAASLTAW
jgi:hypothetical protein